MKSDHELFCWNGMKSDHENQMGHEIFCWNGMKTGYMIMNSSMEWRLTLKLTMKTTFLTIKTV